MSSREFNQDISAAKRAAKDGPVFITDRGRPAHVLLSIEQFRAMSVSPNKRNIADALAMTEPDIDFDPPKLKNVFDTPDL